MDGDNRLPFQLVHRKTGLATEILAGICIVKLSCNHIFWIQDVPTQLRERELTFSGSKIMNHTEQKQW